MERNKRRFSDTDDHQKDRENEKYRFGMGIDIVDQNILSGPDIERAVNGIVIAPDKGDDNINEI